MKTVLLIFAGFVVLLAAFIIWRWTSVVRGATERDEKLIARIDPLAKKIDAGQPIMPQEVATLAARPEIRFLLFAALRHMNRSDLLPSGYSASVAQGESALAYWVMHPNELGEAPATIELMETIKRPVDGRDADFHVFRYKMPAGHWAEKDGWLLGLAGPMPVAGEPYSELPGAFSRAGDLHDKVKPGELLDWYVGMLKQKGLIK